MNITMRPVATVFNSRATATDDHWGDVVSEIVLADHIPTEAFDNISTFSHLEIIFYFDKVNDDDIVYSGHPRGNISFPKVGIFAQRKKDRPNKIGTCIACLLEHKERKLLVTQLDAINGTPVLDIKPVFTEFQPKGTITQPPWVAVLMEHYWK